MGSRRSMRIRSQHSQTPRSAPAALAVDQLERGVGELHERRDQHDGRDGDGHARVNARQHDEGESRDQRGCDELDCGCDADKGEPREMSAA